MSSFFKSKFTRSELANYMSSLDEQFTFPNPIAKVASKLSKAAHDDSPSSARSSASSFKSVSEPSTPIVDPELLLLSLTIKGNNFEYNGKINEKGEFIGVGEIRFSNGLTYQGTFEQSKMSGIGKFIWKNEDVAYGKFENGVIDEKSQWKLIVVQESTSFMGQVSLTDKVRKLFTQYNNNLPTYFNKTSVIDLDFSIHDILKHGEGEMVFEKYNITYFGSFNKDCREGFGVMVFSDGSKYYGGFKKDCFESAGCYYYPDGTIFMGEYKESKKNGRGTLYLPHGDRIEGIWDNETVKNALFFKGEISKSSLTTLNLLQQKLSRVLTSSPGYLRPEDQDIENAPTPKKWSLYFSLHKKEWDKQVLELCKLDSAEEILQKLFDDENSCLRKFIQFFKTTFQGIYSSAAMQSKLSTVNIPFAIDDVNSFIIFIHQQIQKCFDERKNASINLLQYVYNQIHKDIYTTLFPLYKSCYSEKDAQINSKLSVIRKDAVTSFGVEAIYLPVKYPAEKPFASSVQLFEKLEEAYTPQEKISLLSALRESIIAEVIKNRRENRQKQLGKKYNSKEEQKDKEFQPAVDDLSGAYSYVFSTGKIQNHVALFKYVTDWKDDEVSCMPVIALIGFYEGFLDFIIEVDPYVKDEQGRLLSKFQLQSSGSLSTCQNLRRRIDELEKKLDQSKKDMEVVHNENLRSKHQFEEKVQFYEKMVSESSSNQFKEILMKKEEENAKLLQQLTQQESLSLNNKMKDCLQKQMEQLKEELYIKECKVLELEHMNQQLQNDIAEGGNKPIHSKTAAGQQEDFSDCIYVSYETEDTDEFVIEFLVHGYELQVKPLEDANRMIAVTLQDCYTTPSSKAKLRCRRRPSFSVCIAIPEPYALDSLRLDQGNFLRFVKPI